MSPVPICAAILRQDGDRISAEINQCTRGTGPSHHIPNDTAAQRLSIFHMLKYLRESGALWDTHSRLQVPSVPTHNARLASVVDS